MNRPTQARGACALQASVFRRPLAEERRDLVRREVERGGGELRLHRLHYEPGEESEPA
jgi:hypothetical protein